MQQVIIGGFYALLHITNTEYNALCGGYFWGAEDVAGQLVSTDGVLKNLRIELNDVPGTGTYVFTVRLNGNPTALTCTVAADGTTASDTDPAHNVTITGGDRIDLECNPDNPDNARYARWTIMFDGDNANESLILGNSITRLRASETNYQAPMGPGRAGVTTELRAGQVIPTAGKIKNLYILLSEDPGTTPDGYTFTLRVNGADGLDGGNPLEVAIVANNTSGFDTTHEITVSAGDVVTLECEPINTPSGTPTPYIYRGMTFVADTEGESILMACGEDLAETSPTEYNYLVKSDGSTAWDWTTVEGERYQLAQACTLKKLYIVLDTAPGSGNNYVFTVRRNGTSPVDGLVVLIENLATTGNDTIHTITVSDDDELGMESNPFSNPAYVGAYWGLVSYIAPAAGLENKSANMAAKMMARGFI